MAIKGSVYDEQVTALLYIGVSASHRAYHIHTIMAIIVTVQTCKKVLHHNTIY